MPDDLPKDQSTKNSAAFQPPSASDLKPEPLTPSVPPETPTSTLPSEPVEPKEPSEKPTPLTPTAPPTSIPPEPKLPTTPVTPPTAGPTPPLTPPAPPMEKPEVGPVKPPAGGKSNKAKIVGAVLGLLLLVVALPLAVFLVKQKQEKPVQAGDCFYADNPTHPCNNHAPGWSTCDGSGRWGCDQACNYVDLADTWCEGTTKKTCSGGSISEESNHPDCGGGGEPSEPPSEPPSDDCGYLCSQVTDCGVGPHQSFCHPSAPCRCVCNPEGNWNLSNPWCDTDTHQYYCQGGQRKEDSGGELSDSNLQCAGDIPADSCKPRKTFSGATTTDYDCKKGKSASVTLKACIPEGCPAVDVAYSKTEAYCDCDLTDWEDCEWLGCEGACGAAPSTGTLHLGPGNWCDTVTASCKPRNLCGTCQVDIDGYGVRRWHDEGCEEPEYEATCESCKVYEEDFGEITDLSTLKVGQKIILGTLGSTDHPEGITKARFRISVDDEVGSWQEGTEKFTTSEGKSLFYIEYTIPSEGSYKVESMVYNPVLGWY